MVIFQNLMDDWRNVFQLRLPARLHLAITGWFLVGDDLLQRGPTQFVLAASGALAQLARQHSPTHLGNERANLLRDLLGRLGETRTESFATKEIFAILALFNVTNCQHVE